ncbi:MAG: hypothetical protein IKH63_07945 [Prevotella sp.]|nr:hypothetical protein [Prevotella sp.]
MKTKHILICMLAALLALTSCSDDDNTSPTPAKAVLGEWFTQVNTNGVLDGIPYDAYALLVTFQEDGHGLFMQYFLKDGKLVNALGSMTDYTVDRNGNISIVVSEVKVPLGENVHIAGDKLILDMSRFNLRGLTLVHPTDTQKQMIKEWDAIVEEWGGIGGDGSTTATEVTDEGASEPARVRNR